MTHKTRLTLFASAVMMLMGAGGCNLYPDSETRVEDLDIIITRYDKETDFTQLNTYSIVDEVYAVDEDTSNAPDPVDNSDYIISTINANMEALGYQKVNSNSDPDVRIVVTASSANITVYYYNYYGYYYPYWGWGGYYGGWYYPYYGYPVTETYTTGSLFIDMVDYRDYTGSSTDSVRVVWTGIMNGLLEGSSSGITARIKTGVDQAFEQSPYLNTAE